MKKICIVTTRHISYNPRVLKEADAFYQNGYDVTVVTVNNHADQYHFDRKLMEARKWKLLTVNFRRDNPNEKQYWLRLSLQQKFFAVLSRFTFGFGIAERAAQKGFDALKILAAKQRADFYLAHHAEALGVAYEAAKANRAGLGFDAEDFHSGMNEGTPPSKAEALISFLETKYLPHCTHITAASKGIGEAYERKYGPLAHTTVLNVFPKENTGVKKAGNTVRFYWYSQVIGPNRSLETMLEAAAKIDEPFELHLRGNFHSPEYRMKLETAVRELRLQDRVFFHPPILAEHIIADAAQFDVGLALESDVSVNRNICVTNKIFSYLMSGLAIVGTDTYGQADIFSHFPEAVRQCRVNDAESLRKAMHFFLCNPAQLSKAKQAARKAADQDFNWERESRKLLKSFQNATHKSDRSVKV